MDPRTKAQLDKMTPEMRAKAEALMAKHRTPEARAKEEAAREDYDRQMRETGTIATRRASPWRSSARSCGTGAARRACPSTRWPRGAGSPGRPWRRLSGATTGTRPSRRSTGSRRRWGRGSQSGSSLSPRNDRRRAGAGGTIDGRDGRLHQMW